MEASRHNIDDLKKIGFQYFKKETFIFMDIKAKISGGYLFFSYKEKSLPIIQKIDSVKKIIEGIYEHMFD